MGPGLLKHMREFVGEGSLAGSGSRYVSAGPADRISPYHEGRRLHRPRMAGNADLAEVVAEAGLEEGTGGRLEGLAGGLKDFVDDGRHFRKSARCRGMTLQAKSLGAARRALSVRARCAPAGAFPGQTTRGRGGNHLGRHAVRFLLIDVTGLIDRELRLERRGREQCRLGAVAESARRSQGRGHRLSSCQWRHQRS